MEIVFLDAYSFNPGDVGWEMFEEPGHVTAFDPTPPEQIAERIASADAVFTNRCRLGEAEFSAAPKLRFLKLTSDGVRQDRPCRRKKAPRSGLQRARIFHNGGCAGICAAAGFDQPRALSRRRSAQRPLDAGTGRLLWDYPLVCLDGKTFGVVGTGEIGCAAARIARGFGMRVLGFSRTKRKEFEGEYVSLDELLRESDVVSLHCPANAETTGMINREYYRSNETGRDSHQHRAALWSNPLTLPKR